MSLCGLCASVASVLVVFLLLFASGVAAASPAGGAKLIFKKIFKSSTPEFVEIAVSDSGDCTYDIRQLDDDPEPLPCAVGRPVVERLFALAGQLNFLRDANLDIKKRIANLGQKTLRYERGSEANEATFNYTTNPAAQELTQVFEGLSRQQAHLQNLQHRMRFDRLGVNDVLLGIEADLGRKILPEPERLLPALEAVVAETRIVDLARQRARSLADRIRAGK